MDTLTDVFRRLRDGVGSSTCRRLGRYGHDFRLGRTPSSVQQLVFGCMPLTCRDLSAGHAVGYFQILLYLIPI